MVERLKIAVEKARAMRASAAPAPGPRRGFLGMRGEAAPEEGTAGADVAPAPSAWDALEPIDLDPARLERNRLIAYAKTDPAHVAFDVLRTRILRAFHKRGWSRLGITSPGKACGKTFVAANLALSMSRQTDSRTILMDMDLRAPGLAKVLGVSHPDPISWFLSGDVTAEDYLRVAGRNLALGLNAKKVHDAAETVLSAATAAALGRMLESLAPDVVIYDLPPMLACDDVLGFLPQLDCVLLVVGGGKTRAADVTECERLLADQTHLLGVLLNQAEDASAAQYDYHGS